MNQIRTFFFATALLLAPTMTAREMPADTRIVAVGEEPLSAKAAQVLAEEAGKRAGTEIHVSDMVKEGCIVLGCENAVREACPELTRRLDALPPTGKEGYRIIVDDRMTVIAGHDGRGVLYGAGRLLQESSFSGGKWTVGIDGGISSTPRKAIRGHEMQPSPRANSPEEAWAKANFEQYVRELALFGMNSIEFLRNIPESYIRIAKSYGMDIWIVTYDNGPDFEPGEGEDAELRFREKIFRRLPTIDHWCMKSGDPGDLTLSRFFEFSEKEAALLKKYHPEAKVWLAPQHFNDAPESYFEEFCQRTNEAPWADGVVFGPWCRLSFEDLRGKIRDELPLRNFPDITHIYSCQYPVPMMDLPISMTHGRICINPSPQAQKHIHNRYESINVGSLTYSEGTNDDFNKFFWLMQDWNPELSAEECTRRYARVFIGSDMEDDYTAGTFGLERNMSGELEHNVGIMETLALWQKMESRADKALMRNPRFLMPLLRAYYDACIYRRWLRELDIERRAFSELAKVGKYGPDKASARARVILDKKKIKPEEKLLRKKCDILYKAVYRDAGRWTMEYQHCPLMDQIDIPLNDSEWICSQLDRIDLLTSKEERTAEIMRLVHRTDVCDGEFYYNLGDFSSEQVTRIEGSWADDPSHLITPHCGLGAKMKKGFVMTHDGFDGKLVPRAWLTQAGMYYDRPLELTFDGLEKDCGYKVRVVYVGEANKFKAHVRMDADGQPVHGPIRLNGDVIVEHDLPSGVTADGKVTLRWQCNEGERGVHISEIFFLKK